MIKLKSWTVIVLLHLLLLTIGAAGVGYFMFKSPGYSQPVNFLNYVWLFLLLAAFVGTVGALGKAMYLAPVLARKQDLNAPDTRFEVICLIGYLFCGALGAVGAMWAYGHL